MQRDEVYEGHWSPFDPKWYQYAFDKFISTADELFNQQDILDQGYVLPDADGSRSSVFRNDAVLNNSFNEKALRETLKDIYLNSSHKLIASNHDNVHFFKWNGHMSDVKFVPTTNLCDIVLPTDPFVVDKYRDKFKLSQFYRKWISITDILTNWDVFNWTCLLFINGKIYSDYQIRIDDHETTIRFKYQPFWNRLNYPIYVYKFDTIAQTRALITKRQMKTWEWKLPVSELADTKILKSDHVVVAINRNNDTSIRKDGSINVDVMGDNLEFLPIVDDYIDMTKISEYNRKLFESEYTEPLWVSIFVPKFLHEYPILLPTDVIYRPYQPNYVPVFAEHDSENIQTKVDISREKSKRNVFINIDDTDGETWDEGWKYIVRPIVLADAFDSQALDPYDGMDVDLRNLRDLTVAGADVIEALRALVRGCSEIYYNGVKKELVIVSTKEYHVAVNYTDSTNTHIPVSTDDAFGLMCDALVDIMDRIHTCHNNFLTERRVPLNEVYETYYNQFIDSLPIIREENYSYAPFYKHSNDPTNFWATVSPLIHIPREFADKFDVSETPKHIGYEPLWEDKTKYIGQHRFRRPIDVSDFWIFEYDNDKKCWRPTIVDVERHFPDVYTLSDPNENTPTPSRIFKAFFFYSDTMNVREPSGDIVRATPSWDKDVVEFELDQGAVYRDIFMEKFYWMGVKEIYKGIINTKYRWAVVEYVQDNPSYTRFNELFLNTMDPYFKMGLATYLKSDNFEFPFDDAIAKLNERLTQDFIGYKRVTNFEVYLNKTWVPSYFDYITRIMDDWDWSSRLVRRPRDSFDTSRLIPMMTDLQTRIDEIVQAQLLELKELITQVEESGYEYDANYLVQMHDYVDSFRSNAKELLDYITNLDLDIFSLTDIENILALIEKHNHLKADVIEFAIQMRQHEPAVEGCDNKREIVEEVTEKVTVDLATCIDTLGMMVQEFDIEDFMKHVNDPAYFSELDHDEDTSLIGIINQFRTPWPEYVQVVRNKLYVSSTSLWTEYSPERVYSNSEIEHLTDLVYEVANNLSELRIVVYKCWDDGGYKYDDALVNLLDWVEDKVGDIKDAINTYVPVRVDMVNIIDEIRAMLINTHPYGISETEEAWITDIDERLDTILDILSHVAGDSDEDLANAEKDAILNDLDRWLNYIGEEKDAYEDIITISTDNNQFITSLTESDTQLNAIAEYLRSVDRDFVPDSNQPTYSDVYEVENIDITTGGFNHNIRDNVYVPNVGAYAITDVEGDVSTASGLESLNYRTTTFRDPCWAGNPYDTITSGNGLGLTIAPTSSFHYNIINDAIVDRFIERVENIVYLTDQYCDNINPYNNTAVGDIITSIRSTQHDWEHTLSFYSDHMSDAANTNCTDMVNSTEPLADLLQDLIDTRTHIDLDGFLTMYNQFIIDTYSNAEQLGPITPTYIYFDNRMRAVYANAEDLYGNGSNWNNATELTKVIDDCIYEIKLYHRKIMNTITTDELETKYTNILSKADDILVHTNSISTVQVDIRSTLDVIREKITTAGSEMQKDVWYRISSVGVGNEGSGYSVGDIVKIVPELPTDIYGNPITDQEELVMNDVILMKITQVTESGGVLKVEPMMEYAIPYRIWGARHTETLVGSGEGLIATVYSYEITLNDSTLFVEPGSYIPETPQFDQNDLFTFKFENIHDLDIQYEVFFGGKQIRDFVVRHEPGDDPLHPSNIDVIYLKAKDVMELGQNSICVKGEHYFIYRLDSIEVIDPGAGYAKGQEIFIDTDQIALKMRISELLPTPYKEIASIEMLPNQRMFNGSNPMSDQAHAIGDSMNNIDDEFHNSYYDNLTDAGIVKPATMSFDPDEYTFTSHRYDELTDGERNKTYMYPSVEMPEGDEVATDGDPDEHWYLGGRADNPERPWEGIMNLVPPTDPFISDDVRYPSGRKPTGEYQEIDRLRIHNSECDMMDSIADADIEGLVNGTREPGNLGTYSAHDNEFSGISEEDVPSMVDGTYEPTGAATVIIDGETIRAVDTSRIRDLIYRNIQPIPYPGPFIDQCFVSLEPNMVFERSLMNTAMASIDLSVETHANLPQHIQEWPEARIGRVVIVEHDETCGGHRMAYKLRTFLVTGYLVYEMPEIADYKWNYFDIDWLKVDFYPDLPTLKAQYPGAPWRTAPTYRIIQHYIEDGDVERKVTPIKHEGTYIHNLTIDDLSVFNYTTKQWEDLHDETKWRLDVREDPGNNDYGFRLTYLEEGIFSYDMRLYLNKVPETQMRNAELKKDAIFKVLASIRGEVNTLTKRHAIDVGKHLRIRKLFPYEQKQTYTIGTHVNDYEMDFKLANYMHFKNEIHLEDIKIYNKTAGRFEDVMNPRMFEVRFKDDRAVARGYETQTVMVRARIAYAGEGFTDGQVWGWNRTYGIHLFGSVTTDFMNDGSLLTFKPLHCPNPPTEDLQLEFEIYQNATQRTSQSARVIVEFQTQRVQVYGDGYIHNVTNPLAPVPKEFKVICQYDLDGPTEYDIIINKSPKTWVFVEPNWMIFPTFHLPDVHINADSLYIMIDKGRMPLVNPSTKKPSFYVEHKDDGTDVTFLNLYHKYEHMEVRSVPYPMRSVYVQRRVPKSGFVDLTGKINKPLNKKYFEFWMNGRLLFDEVTIITPTKIFLHGLKSLRNFEIIEVNRDPNEYFSDNFLEVDGSKYSRPYPHWNYDTYLDDALTGTLDGDNYTLAEQEALLSPVWKQVDETNSEYKNFPPNQDVETDILVRVDDYASISDIAMPAYQFIVLDVPTIEGVSINSRGTTFEQLGFIPIGNDMLMDMMNDEWAEEIGKAGMHAHSVISDDEWYGLATRLYDEYGIQVHNLNEAVYKVIDDHIVRINSTDKLGRVVRNPSTYDLD